MSTTQERDDPVPGALPAPADSTVLVQAAAPTPAHIPAKEAFDRIYAAPEAVVEDLLAEMRLLFDSEVARRLNLERPSAPFLTAVIENLADAGVVVREGRPPLFDVAGGLGLSPAAIGGMLEGVGIASVLRDEVHAARFPSDGGPDVIAEFFVSGRNMLGFRARHSLDRTYDPTLAALLDAVERYNAELSFGAMNVHPEREQVTWSARIPVSEVGMDGAMLDWLVDKAVFVLDRLAAEVPAR